MPTDHDDTLLDARLTLPEHVVHRSFVTETVVLNLQTGHYHGLNPTGARMLEVLGDAPSVRQAAIVLADEYDHDLETVQADLVAFCAELLERRLLEVVGDEAAV